MPSRVLRLVSRVVLLVMLATFLSPSLGWQMIASHDQLAHAAASHGAGADHDHDGRGDHGDAHSSIGHVFTHMPMNVVAISFVVPPAGKNLAPLPPKFSVPDTPCEALFKPPRLTSFS